MPADHIVGVEKDMETTIGSRVWGAEGGVGE